MEAFVFPFLFLEVSLALGAINGYGKNKKAMLLPHQTQNVARPRAKEERIEEEEEDMEEMDGCVYSAIWVGLGGKEMLNFEGKWV